MKVLQIGLGSMGKRRIRNLQALGFKDIIGFDLREDRRLEANKKYGITTTGILNEELINSREVFIISTPPDWHNHYIKIALKYKKPAFVEASVIRKGLLEFYREALRKKIKIFPSCTLRFHPAIKAIKSLVTGGKYGKICNFSYHMGQYLPDWHPWEHIKDFYVSKRETSAAREMVPFELTWILDIMGSPKEVFAFRGKTHNLGVDIDDTYAINLKFKDFLGVIIIDVVSRFAVRSLILNLEKAHIRWNWEERQIKLYDARQKKWEVINIDQGQAALGYNENITEGMYIDEMNTFMGSLKGKKVFPNSLKDDEYVLSILEASEKCGSGKKV